MKKSIITAISSNHAIGKNNELIFNIPEDLRRFKKITSGHFVAMGRKTFESIGKPLPNRNNIIITNNNLYQIPEECYKAGSLEEAIQIAENNGEEEMFIIGGGTLYDQALNNNLVDTIYLTRVMETYEEADTFFPPIDYRNWNFRKVDEENQIERKIYKGFDNRTYDYEFMILDNINSY